MAKGKLGTKGNPVKINGDKLLEILTKDERTIDILWAQIKDGICNYTYEILQGIGAGAKHKVSPGPGLIKDELELSFEAFHVHLAVIDGVFKHHGIEIDDIDKYHNHELTIDYNVTEIKVTGGLENESIELTGSKRLDTGGRMDLDAPKIPLDNLSSYKWYNELKAAAQEARRQVEKYHGGNYIPIKKEEEEEKDDPKQGKLFDKAKGIKPKVSDDIESGEI